ncbi:MAG TPA: class I SAM-dependent methyltransferase [Thermoanaerobaculia bacterium]
MSSGTDLAGMYDRRFAGEARFRVAMWRVLCQKFFQRYVDRSATVLEVGAGHCEFINNIEAARKIAVDLSNDTPHYAAAGVQVVQTASTDLSAVAGGTADVAFASNFFEHISKPDILATLRELRRVLRPDGKLLILQPNIRYCARDYWMFFDHITPLDDSSLIEALELCGLEAVEVIRRFLPFTTKSALPKSLALLRIYLAVPLLWRLFGAQSFIVARPRP